MIFPFHRLLSALVFAVLWTAFMAWWNAEYRVVNVVILSIIGLIVGLVWAWAMERVQRRRDARSK